MVRMRKHINWSDISNLVEITRKDDIEVSRECRGITAHVDDILCLEANEIDACARMESVSWRIDDEDIRMLSSLEECREKIFDFRIHEGHMMNRIYARISFCIICRRLNCLDGIDFFESTSEEYPDRPSPSIEIEKDISLLGTELCDDRIESLGSTRIRLKETQRLNLELFPEKYFRYTLLSEDALCLPCHDICLSRVLEEKDRDNMRKLFLKGPIKGEEFFFFFFTPVTILRIHTPEKHDLREYRLTYYEVTEKSLTRTRIVRGESRVSGKSVNIMEDRIYFFISKDTVSTILYPIKLSLYMKSESERIIYPFAIRYIFSP